jgi:hypothetical protein
MRASDVTAYDHRTRDVQPWLAGLSTLNKLSGSAENRQLPLSELLKEFVA